MLTYELIPSISMYILHINSVEQMSILKNSFRVGLKYTTYSC